MISRFRPCWIFHSSKAPVGLGSLLGINHPGNTESICARSETWRPEGLFEWHSHCSVFGQCVENTLALGFVLRMDRYVQSRGLFVTVRRRISTHQNLVADAE